MITGNLNVIPDARVRNIISKGPKYIFPSNIDFPKRRREIAASLNEFGNRWCKLENVEPDALKEWKINIFKIIDTRISFYFCNTHLLPLKPKSSFQHLNTRPCSAVGNVSGYRCVSDCRSRGREFNPGPVSYFRGD